MSKYYKNYTQENTDEIIMPPGTMPYPTPTSMQYEPGALPEATDVCSNPAAEVDQPGVDPNPSRSCLHEYLCRHIGRYVKVDFFVGGAFYLERSGILSDVGSDYILIGDSFGSLITCDISSIKFVSVST